MSLRVQILSLAPPLAVSLSFFSAFVAAGINVTATCEIFSWTFNSIGQSPCIVAAYMLATCSAGSYTLTPQPQPTGGMVEYAYQGPTRDSSNTCTCSTVGYSLMSACVACQDVIPMSWSNYVANCTTILPPSQFPNPVPAGIYVPHWAIVDVTIKNQWDENQAYETGDSPEYGPGAIFGPSGVYTQITYTQPIYTGRVPPFASTSSASASPTSTTRPTPSHSGSHARTIAGGLIGGIVTISLAVAATLYLRRRRRSQTAFADAGSNQLMPTEAMVAQSQVTTTLHNPNDPTTIREDYIAQFE